MFSVPLSESKSPMSTFSFLTPLAHGTLVMPQLLKACPHLIAQIFFLLYVPSASLTHGPFSVRYPNAFSWPEQGLPSLMVLPWFFFLTQTTGHGHCPDRYQVLNTKVTCLKAGINMSQSQLDHCVFMMQSTSDACETRKSVWVMGHVQYINSFLISGSPPPTPYPNQAGPYNKQCNIPVIVSSLFSCQREKWFKLKFCLHF